MEWAGRLTGPATFKTRAASRQRAAVDKWRVILGATITVARGNQWNFVIISFFWCSKHKDNTILGIIDVDQKYKTLN